MFTCVYVEFTFEGWESGRDFTSGLHGVAWRLRGGCWSFISSKDRVEQSASRRFFVLFLFN